MQINLINLQFQFDYEWTPFMVGDSQLDFRSFQNGRLLRLAANSCSHGGAVVYKWEGEIDQGEHIGQQGVLIGETDNVRQRLRQYRAGTQPLGNVFWREQFLTKGVIKYWILKITGCSLNVRQPTADLRRKNFRLVVEQLLVMELLQRNDPRQWIVNRIQ